MLPWNNLWVLIMATTECVEVWGVSLAEMLGVTLFTRCQMVKMAEDAIIKWVVEEVAVWDAQWLVQVHAEDVVEEEAEVDIIICKTINHNDQVHFMDTNVAKIEMKN